MIAESSDIEGKPVPGARMMSKTAPQMLQNEQAAAAKQARTRFAGGGYAIK